MFLAKNYCRLDLEYIRMCDIVGELTAIRIISPKLMIDWNTQVRRMYVCYYCSIRVVAAGVYVPEGSLWLLLFFCCKKKLEEGWMLTLNS